MSFDSTPIVFIALAAAFAVMAIIPERRGATKAGPRRVMKHINKRRRFMGLPALYMGDPTMPKGWTCNAVRRQEWGGKRS